MARPTYVWIAVTLLVLLVGSAALTFAVTPSMGRGGSSSPTSHPQIDNQTVRGMQPNQGAHLVAAGSGAAGLESTYDLVTGQRILGPDSLPPGAQAPVGVVYDPTNHEMYVTNGFCNMPTHWPNEFCYGSPGVIAGINTQNLSDLTWLPAGPDPFGLALDVQTQELFVASYTDDVVTEVSIATGSIVREVTDPCNCQEIGVAVDSADNLVYVAHNQGSSVSAFSAANLAYEGNVGVDGTSKGITYDPLNDNVYVSSVSGTRVTILHGLSSVGSLDVGTESSSIAVDTANGMLYVGGWGSSTSVDVFNGSNDALESTIVTRNATIDLAYDPLNQEVVAIHPDSDNASVIKGTTIVGNFSTGGYPFAVALSVATQSFFVINIVDNSVTVANSTSLAIEATKYLGYEPTAVLSDLAAHKIFVTLPIVHEVFVLNESTLDFIGTVPVGFYPDAITLDNATGLVVVANGGSSNVTLFNPNSDLVVGSLPAGQDPNGLAFDSRTGDVFVSNCNSKNVTVLQPTAKHSVGNISIGSCPKPGTYVPRPGGGDMVFAGASGIVSIFNDSSFALIENLSTSDFEGTTYDPETGYLYATASDGIVTFDPRTWSIVGSWFGSGVPVVCPVFDPYPGLIVAELGGYDTYVTISPNTDVPTSYLTSGLDPGCGSLDQYWDSMIFPNLESSSLEFVSGQTGDVNFNEMGLGAGEPWTINLDGWSRTLDTNNSTYAVGFGTYSFTVSTTVKNLFPTPSEGSFTESGVALSINVTFAPPDFSIEFIQTGLPQGTSWSVVIYSHSQIHLSSINNTASSQLPNGTYYYAASVTADYSIKNGSGQFSVVGRPELVTLTFVPNSYGIEFREVGLSGGTNWSITIGTDTEWSYGGAVVDFTQKDGNYTYSVNDPSGFRSIPSAGKFVVNRSAVNINITFEQAPKSPPGLTAFELILSGAILLGVAVGIVVVLRFRGRRRPGQVRPPTEPG